MQERISSLRAGLRTWKDHLLRVQRLASECDEKEKKALQAMEEPKTILDTPIPEESTSAQRDLLLCKVCKRYNLLRYMISYYRLQYIPYHFITYLHNRKSLTKIISFFMLGFYCKPGIIDS